MDMQFDLVYRGGGFTWHDVDTMPLYELRYYYGKLCEALRPKDEVGA